MKKEKTDNFSKKLYDKMVIVANKKGSIWILGAISFFESFISPVQPDILMFPLMIAKKTGCFFIAIITAVFGILGGIVGYAIGLMLFSSVGVWLIDSYGLTESFNNIKVGFDKFCFWTIAIKGIVPVPIPFKLLALASGVMKYSFLKFLIASTISRVSKYVFHAALFYFFKDKIESVIKKNAHVFTIYLMASATFVFLLFFFL